MGEAADLSQILGDIGPEVIVQHVAGDENNVHDTPLIRLRWVNRKREPSAADGRRGAGHHWSMGEN